MPLSGSDTRVDFAPTSTDICILFFEFFRQKIFARSVSGFFKISRSVGGQAMGMPKRGTFSCPANYGSKEARKDKDRLHHFYCKRISLPSCGGGALSETEDAEEAQLTARVAAFEESPEGRARRAFGQGFPPPWSVNELKACFVVRDHTRQALAYVYFEDEPERRSAAKAKLCRACCAETVPIGPTSLRPVGNSA
jgi:hypothetical protein